MKKNIFVLALDDFNARLLQSIRQVEDYRFHPLLAKEELVAALEDLSSDLMVDLVTD